MSNKVKSSDLYESNLFGDAEASAKSFITQVELLEKSTKQLSTELAKLHAMQGKSYDDIVKLQQGALELIAKNDLLIAAKKEALIVERELSAGQLRANKAANDAIKAEAKARVDNARAAAIETKEKEKSVKASQKLTAEQKEQIKWDKAHTESLVRKRIEYNRLVYQYDNGSAAIRDRLLPQMKELDAEIKSLEEATGRHGRSVGNYKKAFDGLGFSMSQLAREAPAFANSVQTGFMALSNNLPMLFDEIKKINEQNKELRANGEKTIPVWKQLGTAMFSPMMALNVGVLAITLFGDEIVKAVSNLSIFNKKLTEQAQIYKAINEVKAKALSDSANESVQLEFLYKKTQDVNASMAERKKAVDKMQELYPDYLGNMSDEVILAGKATAEYNKTANAIINKAVAKEYADRIAKNKLLLDQQQKIVKAKEMELESDMRTTRQFEAQQKKMDEAYKNMTRGAADAAIVKGMVEGNAAGMRDAGLQAARTNELMSKRAVETERKKYKELKAIDDEYRKNLNILDLYFDENSNKGGGSKKDKALKVINDFRNDIQKGLSRGINIFEGGFSTQKQRDDYLKSVDELGKLRKSQAIKDAETEVEIAQKAYEKRKGLGIKEYADLVNAQKKLRDLRTAAIDEERRAKAEGIAPNGIVRADDPEYATKMNNILAINEKAAADEIELKRKTNDELKKLDDEMLANMKGKALDTVEAMAQMYGSYLSARAKYNEKVLEKQYDANQLTQQRLINATAQGSAQAAETLAYEQKRTAEIQAAQKKNQEAQAKQELFLALLSSVAGEMRSGSSLPVAITKSIASAAVLRGVAAAYPLSFFDGTDDTGKAGAGEDLDGRGGRLMMIHENEMIFSAAQRVRLGGSREEVINKVEQFDKLSNNNDVLVAEMREVKQAIMEKPAYMGMDLDILGGVIDYKLQQGNTLRIIKKNLKNI